MKQKRPSYLPVSVTVAAKYAVLCIVREGNARGFQIVQKGLVKSGSLYGVVVVQEGLRQKQNSFTYVAARTTTKDEHSLLAEFCAADWLRMCFQTSLSGQG